MIVDITYPIETWPKQNELTHITEGIQNSPGGSVCNTITDLARLDPQMPLVASGFAGHDAEGDFLLQEMGKYPNINLGMVKRNGRTSFTAVMSNNQTKERTFFQHAGGNAYYGEDDTSFSGGIDSAIWGRVEVCPELGNLRDDVLSLMYVKDIGDEDAPAITEIKTKDVLGAELLDYALLFVRDFRSCPAEITVDVKSAKTYMVSGLSEGKWTASVDGKSIELDVTADEHFARFELPAGKLTLKKQ